MKTGRILLLGATGTIGQAVLAELGARKHETVALFRADHNPENEDKEDRLPIARANLSDSGALKAIFETHAPSIVISCLASRTGAPRDAWAIDYEAHARILKLATEAGVSQWIQLSAICVQKPRLDFQHAKLAFERDLIASGLTYSIVRPTAYFKSISGQMNRLKAGKPFLVFGDGELTACKPISNENLASYIADCLDDQNRTNQVLPIGGPGPAITAIDQGRLLAKTLGVPFKVKKVPVALFQVIIAGLTLGGKIFPRLADKANLARIGHYYATESMLVWNEQTQNYDDQATPEFGSDTLGEHYARLTEGITSDERGAHTVF
jgi:divinyl chlorophyllide a 8-vinyl-reductase